MFNLPNICIEKICLKLKRSDYLNVMITSKDNMKYLEDTCLTKYHKTGKQCADLARKIQHLDGQKLRTHVCILAELVLKDDNLEIISRFRPTFIDCIKKNIKDILTFHPTYKRALDIMREFECILFFSKGKNMSQKILSNFQETPIAYKNVIFPSVENAFQAAKFLYSDHPQMFENVRIMTPKEAKSFGSKASMKKNNVHLTTSDWNANKTEIMKKLIAIRFREDNSFRKIVVSARKTNRILYHFERSGAYWGGHFKNGEFVGQNILGKIIMDTHCSNI